jgi:hypothetical protein
MSSERTNSASLAKLSREISPRDREIIQMVADLRLMSGHQLTELHFVGEGHRSNDAARRSARRVLQNLGEQRLLARITRRIGGLRAGSESFIYAIGPVGQRLINLDGPRRRNFEPSMTFAEHTLAIADHVVAILSGSRNGLFDVIGYEPEPKSWREFTTISGSKLLRPDLFAALAVDEYEFRWFIEVDLGTEHQPALLRKCHTYQSYFEAGIEQARHGVFPRVCWSMNDAARAERLRDAIAKDKSLTNELFVCIEQRDLVATLSKGLP